MIENLSQVFSKTMKIHIKMQFHGEKRKNVNIIEKNLHSLKPNFNKSCVPSKNQMTLIITHSMNSKFPCLSMDKR